MSPTEKREMLLSFRSRLECLQKIASILERQLPEMETPEELWKCEEVNEAQVKHWLGMLEEMRADTRGGSVKTVTAKRNGPSR